MVIGIVFVPLNVFSDEAFIDSVTDDTFEQEVNRDTCRTVLKTFCKDIVKAGLTEAPIGSLLMVWGLQLSYTGNSSEIVSKSRQLFLRIFSGYQDAVNEFYDWYEDLSEKLASSD